jgi:hypothetical protein
VAPDTHTQAEAGGEVTEGDLEVPPPNRRVIAIPDLHGDMEQAINVLQSALVIDQVEGGGMSTVGIYQSQ